MLRKSDPIELAQIFNHHRHIKCSIYIGSSTFCALIQWLTSSIRLKSPCILWTINFWIFRKIMIPVICCIELFFDLLKCQPKLFLKLSIWMRDSMSTRASQAHRPPSSAKESLDWYCFPVKNRYCYIKFVVPASYKDFRYNFAILKQCNRYFTHDYKENLLNYINQILCGVLGSFFWVEFIRIYVYEHMFMYEIMLGYNHIWI